MPAMRQEIPVARLPLIRKVYSTVTLRQPPAILIYGTVMRWLGHFQAACFRCWCANVEF